MRAVWLLVLAASAAPGCRCVKAALESPPEPVVEERTRTRLKTARELASEMCGIPAEGLDDVVVKVVSQTAGVGTAHVTGTAIPAADGGLDLGKALVCAGVVGFVFTKAIDGDDWSMGDLDLEAVETAGVHFDHDEHHRRQHHHHH